PAPGLFAQAFVSHVESPTARDPLSPGATRYPPPATPAPRTHGPPPPPRLCSRPPCLSTPSHFPPPTSHAPPRVDVTQRSTTPAGWTGECAPLAYQCRQQSLSRQKPRGIEHGQRTIVRPDQDRQLGASQHHRIAPLAT